MSIIFKLCRRFWQTWLLYNMTAHNHLEYYCSQLAGKVKKLVTVFAICFSAIYRDRNNGDNSSTFPSLHPGANTAPWWLARRDYFSAKATGQLVGGTAPPPLSAPTREPLCLSTSDLRDRLLLHDFHNKN
jgi:hypothetical protein